MTDSEKLDLLLAEMLGIRTDMQGMKTDMQDMKAKMQELEANMQHMRTDIQHMKADILVLKADMKDVKSKIKEMDSDLQLLKKKVTALELHIENFTDKNLQLITENFSELVDKLNQSIQAADKNRVNEVRVDFLIEEVNRLKENVEKLIQETA